MVLDGKPKPLTVATQTTTQKRYFVGALNLGSELPTGDYVLQTVVIDSLAKDKRKVATQWIQFEIKE